MSNLFKTRKPGAYVLAAALLLEAVSLINYLAWAAGLHSVDPVIAGGFALGLAAGAGSLLLGSDLLAVLNTALCSCGVLRLHVSNAGSFADAYQGIVMFGDSSQVGRILTICASAFLCVLLLIASGFLGFGKREA